MSTAAYPLNVVNPDQLPNALEGSISRLEGNYNFKPHIGLLANGEIVMFVAHAHNEEKITCTRRQTQNADSPRMSFYIGPRMTEKHGFRADIFESSSAVMNLRYPYLETYFS